MIDLETIGTNVDAPIISIGAAFFDIEKKTVGDTFYLVCDVADQIDSKVRFADASTIKWWMSQGNAAKQVFKDGHKPTKEVLELLRQWIMTHAGSKATKTNKVKVWGNGSSFDITLMETLFKDYGVDCPWQFYNVMDLRTYRRFVGKGEKVAKLEGTNHNALDDAINQINYVLKHADKLNNV